MRHLDAPYMSCHLNPAWARWLSTLMSAVVGLFGLASLRSAEAMGTSGYSVVNVLEMVALSACLPLAVRLWRCELRADDAGVRVRNIFRSRVLPWGDVAVLRDSSVQDHKEGSRWILAVVDSRGRVIRSSASVDLPTRQVEQLVLLAHRNGVPASLSPFHTTKASEPAIARVRPAGWYTDPLTRYPVRYHDAAGWTTVVASWDESGSGALVSHDAQGLPNLPWLHLGGAIDTANVPTPPLPALGLTRQARASRRIRLQLAAILISLIGLMSWLIFFGFTYPAGIDPLGGLVGILCLFGGLFGAVALPVTLIVLIRDRLRRTPHPPDAGPPATATEPPQSHRHRRHDQRG